MGQQLPATLCAVPTSPLARSRRSSARGAAPPASSPSSTGKTSQRSYPLRTQPHTSTRRPFTQRRPTVLPPVASTPDRNGTAWNGTRAPADDTHTSADEDPNTTIDRDYFDLGYDDDDYESPDLDLPPSSDWWEQNGLGFSQPARGVQGWIPVEVEPPKPSRPWWAWWDLGESECKDPSLNLGLVSDGATVARLFTQEEWTRHRNPLRYYRYMWFLIRAKSVVLIRSLANLLIINMWALTVTFYNSTVPPSHTAACNPLYLTLLGAFVSLLLVFRTNSSYARFAEARMLLSQLVLYTREFSRLAVIHFPRKLALKSIQYLIIYAWCLKARVRAHDNPEPVIRDLIGRRAAHSLLRQGKPAFAALQELTKILAECEHELPSYVSYGLDQSLSNLDRVLGGCERIINTPIPLSYTRHTSRSLFLYLLAVPIGLWSTCGWSTVPLTLVMSYILLGIDETGVHIEEPFGIMPLQQLCQGVQASCQETYQLYCADVR